jgi:hypothetical protein
MTDPCIYCGATDHQIVTTVVGPVRLCARAPDGIPTLSPRVIGEMGNAANTVIHEQVMDYMKTFELAKRRQ